MDTKDSTNIARRKSREIINSIEPLATGFLIHHIDANPLNIDISNLAVLTSRQHYRIHRLMYRCFSQKIYPHRLRQNSIFALPTFQQISNKKFEKIKIICFACGEKISFCSCQLFNGINIFNICLCDDCAMQKTKYIFKKAIMARK